MASPPTVFGLQLSVCNLEFSVYYGHQLCSGSQTPVTFCPEIPDNPTCWLVQALPAAVGPSCAASNSNVAGFSNNNFSLSKALSGWPELLWAGHDSFLFEKVRATSFIFLLGVGSFVCYRIFHHFNRRLQNKRNCSTTCKKLYSRKRHFYKSLNAVQGDAYSDTSSISDITSSETNSLYNDREFTSVCASVDDEKEFIMGVSSSSQSTSFEPVQYNKVAGVVLKRSDKTSTQMRNVVTDSLLGPNKRSLHRRQQQLSNNGTSSTFYDDKENGFNISGSGSFGDADGLAEPFVFDDLGFPGDTASMKGNFSPGSLHEKVQRTEEYWNAGRLPVAGRPTSLNFEPTKRLSRQYSNDSFSIHSDSRGGEWPMSRTFSIDSQVSELAPELQQQAVDIGCVAVEQIETLENELLDLKQTVLDLDAEFVQLKVYKQPPERCWELTNISLSDGFSQEEALALSGGTGGILDVVQHHKTKMWYKGLLGSKKPSGIVSTDDSSRSPQHSENCDKSEEEVRWDLVSRRFLDWDVETENTFDSGSDFGNSLETDSVDMDATSCSQAPVSLEWDLVGVSEIEEKLSKEVVVPVTPSNTGRASSHPSSEILFSSSSSAVKSRSQKRKRLVIRRNSSFESLSTHPIKLNRTRSNNALSDILTNQIQRIVGKGLPVNDQSPSMMVDSSPHSAFILGEYLLEEDESGFHERQINICRKEISESTAWDNNGNSEENFITPDNRSNWDSAYCEGSDFLDSSRQTCNIGDLISVSAFMNSASQNNLVKGYEAAVQTLKVVNMRRICGDKSCIIRAVLFQLLTSGHSILLDYGGASMIYQALTSWSQTTYPWLLEWSFSNKLTYKGASCIKGFWECLHSLEEMEQTLRSVEDPSVYLKDALNEVSELDAKLIESVKLLLAASCLRLHEHHLKEGNSDGGPMQMFTMLLFGRDTCRTPKELIVGQLNKLGETVSLDKVGLYLLGHTLNASIELVKPHLVDTCEFLTCYPDWSSNQRHSTAQRNITLITEDDCNYWILTR